jgi:hypothetical protein
MISLPLWAGLLLNDDTCNQENTSRITNNAVENWFGQGKVKFLIFSNDQFKILKKNVLFFMN